MVVGECLSAVVVGEEGHVLVLWLLVRRGMS